MKKLSIPVRRLTSKNPLKVKTPDQLAKPASPNKRAKAGAATQSRLKKIGKSSKWR